mmetsp:Transcript_80518/g.222731  ORF Transcript_80518/g.222731 Transcript_80518/m.222731 type:complete len:512 (-) Transcript_80518:250-1785(-)
MIFSPSTSSSSGWPSRSPRLVSRSSEVRLAAALLRSSALTSPLKSSPSSDSSAASSPFSACTLASACTDACFGSFSSCTLASACTDACFGSSFLDASMVSSPCLAGAAFSSSLSVWTCTGTCLSSSWLGIPTAASSSIWRASSVRSAWRLRNAAGCAWAALGSFPCLATVALSARSSRLSSSASAKAALSSFPWLANVSLIALSSACSLWIFARAAFSSWPCFASWALSSCSSSAAFARALDSSSPCFRSLAFSSRSSSLTFLPELDSSFPWLASVALTVCNSSFSLSACARAAFSSLLCSSNLALTVFSSCSSSSAFACTTPSSVLRCSSNFFDSFKATSSRLFRAMAWPATEGSLESLSFFWRCCCWVARVSSFSSCSSSLALARELDSSSSTSDMRLPCFRSSARRCATSAPEAEPSFCARRSFACVAFCRWRSARSASLRLASSSPPIAVWASFSCSWRSTTAASRSSLPCSASFLRSWSTWARAAPSSCCSVPGGASLEAASAARA